MDYYLILYGALVLGAAGLVMGIGLAFASKKFHVEEDPKITALVEALPGANCGACGLPGCHAAATAVFEGRVDAHVCVAGGHEVVEKISEIMGHETPTAKHPEIAFLHCNGGRSKVESRFEYNYPVKDCIAANQIGGGYLACPFGCLGFGTCSKKCPFDAIKMENDLPVVIAEKCTSCGICVSTCPRKLFNIEKMDVPIYVGCSSTDKGKYVRKYCKAGCISCNICEKECPQDAIHVTGDLAIVDYEKCNGCMICVEKCPTKCIYVNSASNKKVKVATKPQKKKESSCHSLPENE